MSRCWFRQTGTVSRIMLVAPAHETDFSVASADNAAASAVLYCCKRLCGLGESSLGPARNSLNAEPIGATSTPHHSTIPAAVPAAVATSARVGPSSSNVSARATCQGSRDASRKTDVTTAAIIRALNRRPIVHLPSTYDFEPSVLDPCTPLAPPENRTRANAKAKA
jgi:hypothetical protein